MNLFWRKGKRTWLGNLLDVHSESLSWIGKCPCGKRECRSTFGDMSPFYLGFVDGIRDAERKNLEPIKTPAEALDQDGRQLEGE